MATPLRMALPRLGVLLILLAAAAWSLAGVRSSLDPGGATLASSLFQAVQMMVGRFPPDLEGRPAPFFLELVRLALPLALVWAVATLVWRQAGNPLRLALLRIRGGHLVLAGDDGLAGPLAMAERRQGRPVLVWTRTPGQPWVRDAADRGAVWAGRDGPGSGARRLGLEKARIVLVAGENDGDNLALADAAIAQAIQERQAGVPLTVIARVDDAERRAALEQRFDLNPERRSARLRFASLPDIAARRLFVDRPFDRFVRGESTAPVIFLFGLSLATERYALRLLAGVHLRDGEKPIIVVFSSSESRDQQAFFSRWPGAERIGRIHFQTFNAVAPRGAEQAILQSVDDYGPPTVVVVDLAAPANSVEVAVAAADVLGRNGGIAPPIYVRAPGEAVASHPALQTFGGPETFTDPEVLLQERLDALAQSIHEFYFEGRLDEGDQIGSRASMQEWDLLPEAVRDDNRLVADCYELKLRDVGARAVATGERQAGGLQLDGEDMESLSRAEHDRWMAAKLLDGWQWGEVRDDARRLHPDIVGYDDLTEPRKDLDREQVRVIGRLLARAGRRAVRDLVVAIDGEAGGDAATMLSGFSTAYPDRTPVLLGDFESAADRRLMAAAAAGGSPVQLIVSRDAAATIDGLAAAEQAGAAALFKGADRIFALPASEWSEGRRRDFMLARAQARIAAVGRPSASLPTVVVDADRVVSTPWR